MIEFLIMDLEKRIAKESLSLFEPSGGVGEGGGGVSLNSIPEVRSKN
jgi:hypothetical protein